MSHDVPATYLLNRAFTDVDDLTVQARQWNLDFRQLSRGKFSGGVLQFGVEDVHVSEARFCRSLSQKGSPPAGKRTIALPASPDVKLKWRRKQIDGQSLMIFPRGSELASVSGPDFHIFTCSFPEELLVEVGEILGQGSIDDLSDGAEAIRIGAPLMNELQSGLQRICTAMRNDSAKLSKQESVEYLTRELPITLLNAIASKQGQCPETSGAKRLAAMVRAEKFIEQRAREGIQVGNVCQAAGVSERTLQNAFLDKFGIGPKEYLTNYRFCSVRRELRASDSRTAKVADVANAWGFWHMGQFAADYQERFEELPSKTLRFERPK